MERIVAIDDSFATGGAAGELDGGLDGFGSAVGEEDAGEAVGGMADERLCGESRQEAAIHAYEVGRIHGEQLLQDGLDLGVIASEGEDAPAGEEVEIVVALGIPEVAAFASDIPFIEADGSQHLDEGRVDMGGVQVILSSAVLFEPGLEVVVHSSPP